MIINKAKFGKANPRGVLKGALLGCGHVAAFHLRAWAQIEGVEIVALANRTIGKAEILAGEFGIPQTQIYNDYLELLEKEELDFVDIATAPHIHRQQVEAAAAYGKNVLCQKPLAPTMADARSMITATKQAGVLLSINENWRWRSWYREIKRLLDLRTIGRPRYIGITKHSSLAVPRPDGSLPPAFLEQSYMVDLTKLIVYEWGIHLIDLFRFFFGDVVSVYARLDKVSAFCRGEDRAVMVLEANGVTGVIDISWATIGSPDENQRPIKYLETVTLEGNQGTISVFPEQGGTLEVATNEGVEKQPIFRGTIEEAYQDSYTAAQRHFVECLRSGSEPETEAADNIKTLEATLAVYESAMKNRVIKLGETDEPE